MRPGVSGTTRRPARLLGEPNPSCPTTHRASQLFERTVWSAPDAVGALDACMEAIAVFVPQVLGLASAIDNGGFLMPPCW